MFTKTSGRVAAALAALAGVLGTMGVLAPSAGAVLVHVGRHEVAGVAPAQGVSPASIPGSEARRAPGAGPCCGQASLSDSGILDYNGGPVLHGVSPYVVFWDPAGSFGAGDEALFARYFADSAADSGKASNVFAVDRQYTDSTGFADYAQTWSPSHVIVDTQPYPGSGQCAESSFPESACLYDAQVQAELSRLIAADGLPTGVGGQAPLYFVVLPPDVNSCFADGQTCADNYFCAYHSSFGAGPATVLYADIPTVLAANNPKGCQADGTSLVQSPNADPVMDVAIKYASHEFNETITDPVNGTGWNDIATGQEDGDECNFAGGFDPAGGTNPNAFLPTLGGFAATGSLFDQLINGHPYYTQSEWSNGDGTCVMQPTASALIAALAAPSSAAPGQLVSADPSASFSTGGYSSATWSFGDGTSQFSQGSPAPVSHAYSAYGAYNLTLTLVDGYGNLSSVSHVVDVHGSPTASFTVSPSRPQPGRRISFDGSGSGEPGGSIASYTWSFGDGAGASGATVTHAYRRAGAYTVTLTVTDPSGQSAATRQTVFVGEAQPGDALAGVRVRRGSRVERLRVTVTGPGTLRVGRLVVRVAHAEVVRVRLALTARQRRILRRRHRLTVRYRLVFTPARGRASSRVVTVRLR